MHSSRVVEKLVSYELCPAAKEEVVDEIGEVSEEDTILSIEREIEESTDVEDS